MSSQSTHQTIATQRDFDVAIITGIRDFAGYTYTGSRLSCRGLGLTTLPALPNCTHLDCADNALQAPPDAPVCIWMRAEGNPFIGKLKEKKEPSCEKEVGAQALHDIYAHWRKLHIPCGTVQCTCNVPHEIRYNQCCLTNRSGQTGIEVCHDYVPDPVWVTDYCCKMMVRATKNATIGMCNDLIHRREHQEASTHD